MTAATTMDATPISHEKYEERAFGFWIYLMSDAIIFALLFATYVVMLGNTAGGPTGKELFSLERAAGETALLLLSSATFGFADVALANADTSRALLGWVIGSPGGAVRSWGDQVGWTRKPGSLRPSKIGGYKPRAIAGEHRTWLLQRIREKDFTLRGLVAELAARGLKVDYRSVWSFVHDEKLSFKKGVVAGERERPDVARRRAQWSGAGA
jgi:hypothetical protein